jgi:hypothetical protein
MEEKREYRCLGKTPGFVRYSGYDTSEVEAECLPTLGPIWFPGDPIPGVDQLAADGSHYPQVLHEIYNAKDKN